MNDVTYHICYYLTIQDLLKAQFINKTFYHNVIIYLTRIVNGNINPHDYFTITHTPFADFDYPLSAFLCEEGEWQINNQDWTKASALFCQQLLKQYHVYFYRVGEHDSDSWIIIGQSDTYYIYFEASCDYTGFDCRGGGDFYYHTDWTYLWNMCITDCCRKLMLKYYGYDQFKLN